MLLSFRTSAVALDRAGHPQERASVGSFAAAFYLLPKGADSQSHWTSHPWIPEFEESRWVAAELSTSFVVASMPIREATGSIPVWSTILPFSIRNRL
ncbi:MAG: hypothetical protein WKG07_46160 [Hymenobacter sp.]